MSTQNQESSRLPDFIIIGAAKSGTTSLHRELSSHPHIFMPAFKEPCYFDTDMNWDRGLDWYKSLFEPAIADQICGEASTNYSRWPQVADVPRRIHELIPDVKLVYVMRDPVQRAYSHYVHRWTKEIHPHQPFTEGFAKFVKSDPMCLDSGKYCDQIEQFLDYFPRNNLHLIIFEELLTDKSTVISKLFQFLGINYSNANSDNLVKENVNQQVRYHISRQAIMQRYAFLSPLKGVSAAIPQTFKNFIFEQFIAKLPLARSISQGLEPIPLTEQETSDLYDYYRPYNEKLAKSFNLDLSLWQPENIPAHSELPGTAANN